jgi:hypothetical protein
MYRNTFCNAFENEAKHLGLFISASDHMHVVLAAPKINYY